MVDEGSSEVELPPIEVIAEAFMEIPPLEVEISDQTFVARQPNTIPESQERVRGTLSFIFAGIFGVAVLLPIVLVFIAAFIDSLAMNDVWLVSKDWLQLILPPVTGIVGAAVGFYFGTRDNNSG